MADSEHGAWIRVEDASTAATVRRTAERLALSVALGPRAADLAIVVSELATNLAKHADEGLILLRPVRAEVGGVSQAGVEVIAMDSGPGMADLPGAHQDGLSTAGTLGVGLGAITRLATVYDGVSTPGRGTILTVQVWPGQAPPAAWAQALTRPLSGESVSGDGYAVRVIGERHQALVCDGLGHGPLAAAATQAAVAAFHTARAGGPAQVVEQLHAAMSHTRGAALAVAELDPSRNMVRYAGLGNIAGSVIDDGVRRGLVSLPGIAGHQRRSIREYEYPMAPHARLVMHSDGVSDRWQPADYQQLLAGSPLLLAAALLRDAGVRRDDACVLVAGMPT
jgi:anti-sigma regulatory factor (Ser/Thr protein kinase)